MKTVNIGVGSLDPMARNGLPRHILFLMGIPASGKSTYAKKLVRDDKSYKRVNKDELRFMVHDEDFSTFDKEKEKFIERTRDALIFQALNDGYNVVVDDTNLAEKHWSRIVQIATDWSKAHDGAPIVVEQKLIELPLEEALARNAARVGKTRVPDTVVYNMHAQLTGQTHDPKKIKAAKDRRKRQEAADRLRVYDYRPFDPSKLTVVVFDMDGTTSIPTGRNPYDEEKCLSDGCNEPVLGLLHDLMHRYPLVGVTGRQDKVKDITCQWLRNHGVKFFDPEVDEKPVGVLEVFTRKTGDRRHDYEVKVEIYEQEIFPRFNVKFVLDDRQQVVDAIRKLGVAVFQVAPGNF